MSEETTIDASLLSRFLEQQRLTGIDLATLHGHEFYDPVAEATYKLRWLTKRRKFSVVMQLGVRNLATLVEPKEDHDD
jgi:hypothetical protein